MRLEKEVKIERTGEDPINVKVYEVRTKDLFELLPAGETDESMRATVEKVLPLCSDIDLDGFLELYPSEQQAIIEAFKEVNAPFLSMTGQLGLGPIVERLRSSLVNDLLAFATDLLPPDTPTASTTAGAGSSAPSRP